MKHPQMSLTVSGGLRSDTAPLAPGKQPCLCPARRDWKLGCQRTALILPKSPGQDPLRLRLWFPVPSVPFLGGTGSGTVSAPPPVSG